MFLLFPPPATPFPILSVTSIFVSVSISGIHERTISLRFPGIISRVLRLEVSAYSVYFTNQFQITFAQGRGGEGVKSVGRGDSEWQGRNSQDFGPN